MVLLFALSHVAFAWLIFLSSYSSDVELIPTHFSPHVLNEVRCVAAAVTSSLSRRTKRLAYCLRTVSTKSLTALERLPDCLHGPAGSLEYALT
jgi:hypothetical protein